MKRFKMINKETVQKIILIIFSLLITFFIEVFIFHASYWDTVPTDVQRLEIGSYLEPSEKVTVSEENIFFPEGRGEIEFLGVYEETKNISFTIESRSVCEKGYVLLRDDGNAYGWIQANTFQTFPTADKRKITLELRSKGEMRDVKIVLENGKSCTISNVTINEDVSFHILWRRVLLLFLVVTLIIGIIKWNWLSVKYDNKNIVQMVGLCIIMFMCIWFARNVYQGFFSDAKDLEYPLTENENAYLVENNTPDVQMFDALMKGMSHVDQYPSEELKNLDNPYDFSERKAKDMQYWWDASYYNDNYYFYFGQSSIVLVTIPYYLLTGKIPSDKNSLFILSVITICGIFFMIRQVFRKFKIEVSYILYITFNLAVVFGSMTYFLLRLGSYYLLTISTAIACMTLSIGLAYAAVCNNNKIIRRIFFLLSGIFCVLVAESRPSSTILVVGAVAPLFISVLIDHERNIKNKVIDAASFMIPVIFGAVAIMYYNYIRFDNVFEFGLTYQLTVRDISYDEVRFTPKKILSAIYFYFFKAYQLSPDFPYLVINDSAIKTNGNYIYNEQIAGIFALFPISWGVFALPFLKEKKIKLEKVTYVSMLISAVLLAVFDYLKSGLIERYLSEISMITVFVAGIVLLHKIKMKDKWGSIIYIILTIITIVFSILLILAIDFGHNYQQINIQFILRLREFLSFG